MKKVFLLLSFVIGLFSFTVIAQETNMTNPNGLTIDTVVDATPEGPYLKVPATTKQVGFVLEATKISGTVAGKLYLQGATRSGQWAYPYLDSVAVTDASNNWQLKTTTTGTQFQYYRIRWVGTGTMQASYRATAYIKKE